MDTNNSVKNPFEDPETVSPEINNQIKQLIRDLISKKQLDFYKMSEYTIAAMEEKNLKKTKICCYYCANVVMSNNNLSKASKLELINGLWRDYMDTFYPSHLHTMTSEQPRNQ